MYFCGFFISSLPLELDRISQHFTILTIIAIIRTKTTKAEEENQPQKTMSDLKDQECIFNALIFITTVNQLNLRLSYILAGMRESNHKENFS